MNALRSDGTGWPTSPCRRNMATMFDIATYACQCSCYALRFILPPNIMLQAANWKSTRTDTSRFIGRKHKSEENIFWKLMRKNVIIDHHRRRTCFVAITFSMWRWFLELTRHHESRKIVNILIGLMCVGSGVKFLFCSVFEGLRYSRESEHDAMRQHAESSQCFEAKTSDLTSFPAHIVLYPEGYWLT